MKNHQNWEKARRRFTDLWENKPTKIPYVGIRVNKESMQPWPSQPAKDEDYWLDPEWNARRILVDVENQYWLGETVPGQLLLAGWMISLGGKPAFNRHTIWFEPYQKIDFNKPSPFRHNPLDPWFLKYKRLFEAVVKTAAKGEFGVNPMMGLPANDLLSMHMGTDNFFFAMMDHPEWVRDAIIQGADDLLNVKRDFLKFSEKHLGDLCCSGVGWMPLWSPKPYIRTQSDVSCMLSPDMFEEFVLPELEIYGKKFPLWYHLDGGDARQHLPILFSLPYLKFIQYTPTPSEPGNGMEHLELYRQIQEAGKIVHVSISSDRITEKLVKELDPSKILFDTRTETLAQAEALLNKIGKWCG